MKSPENVEALISESTRLKCSGKGTFGLSLGWGNDTDPYRSNGNYKVAKTVILPVTMELADIEHLQCETHPLFLKCSKQFTCSGFYEFDNLTVSQSATTLSLKVCKYYLFIYSEADSEPVKIKEISAEIGINNLNIRELG